MIVRVVVVLLGCLRGLGVTSVDRTAYPRFGRVVPGRELAEAFAPTDTEVEWTRAKTEEIAARASQARCR